MIIDDFSGQGAPSDDIVSVDHGNCMTGLDLKADRTWMISADTTNAQYTHYSYAVCQRSLFVTSVQVAIDENVN